MKKISVLLVIILFAFFAIVFFKKTVGDIRPALLPSTKPIEKSFEKVTASSIGETPSIPLRLPADFRIGLFAKGLSAPRDLAFSPGGILLASIPSRGTIVALPDKDNDGKADQTKEILINLDKPHGLAFHNGKLFVVEETRVVRYLWDEGKLSVTKDKELFTLPKGGNHRTRTIAFNSKGQMFISLGSTCDVCFEKNEWLAAVVVSDKDGNNPRLFAKGLRNSVFITVNPTTDELWGTEMGRDFLGDNLPPDEINIIRGGRDYGWPVCYGSKVYDTNFGQRSRDYCTNTEAPIFEIAAHSAPLGLTFIESQQFPSDWQGDLLVAYHGSWNRSIPIGYKVVRLDVEANTIQGEEDFLTGFLSGSEALGRPVDLTFDQQGSLYVSDDKAGVIYKVVRQ